MTTNQKIDGVPRDYVLRLTPEAHSVLLGMVEHCLNVRACMGMDEGFKDFDTEEEHDFVKELRALLDAPATWLCDTCKVEQPTERVCDVCGAQTKPAAQPQGEPVAWTEFDVLDFMSVALRHAEYSGLAPSDILDGLRYMAEKGRPALYAEQRAPVAVVLPADWQDQLLDEMTTRFELNKHDDDHMVYDDTQIGVEFARDWIAKRLNTK